MSNKILGMRMALPCAFSLLMTGVACQSGASYDGITDDRLSSYVETLPVGSRLTINSTGGSPASAQVAAATIVSRNLQIRVEKNCLSACAEFIIPAGGLSVDLGPEALIGFHGNDFISQALISREGRDPGRSCGAGRFRWLNDRYDDLGLRKRFYLEVMDKLGVDRVRFDESDCLSTVIDTHTAMWFPSSEQVRSEWGFPSAYSLCSDRQSCWRGRLLEVIGEDERVTVGTKTYYRYGTEFVEMARFW